MRSHRRPLCRRGSFFASVDPDSTWVTDPSCAARVACNTPGTRICQKPDTAQVFGGLPKPPADRYRPPREGNVEDRAHPIDCGACRGLVRQHQNRRDRFRVPAWIVGQQLRHDPRLRVHRSQHGLDTIQLRLDLDQEERSCACVPGQDIHRSAVAIAIERVLDDNLPTLAEPGHDCLHEPGVSGVQEPIELGSFPSENHADGDPQWGGDLLDRAQGRVVGLAAFEQRDGLLSHRSQRGELYLRQSATAPNGSKDSARLQRFHAARMQRTDCTGLTSGLLARHRPGRATRHLDRSGRV